MTCKVTGAPKPEVKWVRDGLELTGGRYKVMEDGNLEIRWVELFLFKLLFCLFSNHILVSNIMFIDSLRRLLVSISYFSKSLSEVFFLVTLSFEVIMLPQRHGDVFLLFKGEKVWD